MAFFLRQSITFFLLTSLIFKPSLGFASLSDKLSGTSTNAHSFLMCQALANASRQDPGSILIDEITAEQFKRTTSELMRPSGPYSALGLTPVSSISRSELVFVPLIRAIFDGDLWPGDKLTETDLAKQFGVAQNSIREASLQLRFLGLLQYEQHHAKYVTNLTQKDVAERVETRIPLEQLAFDAIRNEPMPVLRQLIDDMEDSVRWDAEALFYRRVWKLAKNSILYQKLTQLSAPLFVFEALRWGTSAQVLGSRIIAYRKLMTSLATNEEEEIHMQVAELVTGSYSDFLTSPHPDIKSFLQAA